jgi:hypothetical protein
MKIRRESGVNFLSKKFRLEVSEAWNAGNGEPRFSLAWHQVLW